MLYIEYERKICEIEESPWGGRNDERGKEISFLPFLSHSSHTYIENGNIKEIDSDSKCFLCLSLPLFHYMYVRVLEYVSQWFCNWFLGAGQNCIFFQFKVYSVQLRGILGSVR